MVKMKKMKIMYQDGLDMKEYVKNGTLYSARRTWQVRSNMLDLAGNFPNHSKYKESMGRCKACDLQVREDQEHVTECVGYQDLRTDADLEQEPELVNFFSKVMERRQRNGWI